MPICNPAESLYCGQHNCEICRPDREEKERILRTIIREFTEVELHNHAVQLAALGMCCINRPLGEGRREIMSYIEKNFKPRRKQ